MNSTTFDDAGVYRLDRHRALVQTVDFFTPIVDDPFSYGQIAAANSLSDIFAMGGRPLTALNIVGFPTDLVRPRVIAAILRGGLAKAAEVGCAIIGGHSIRNPEPIYGLAVTGVIDVRRLTTNANARPGDLLVLTKPLGTGIATTAIKRGTASRTLQKRVIALMSKVNTVGAELAELRLVRAATDVTGYGLMGHLISLCRASGVSAEVDTSAVPMISDEIADLIEQGCVPGGSRENLVGYNRGCRLGKHGRSATNSVNRRANQRRITFVRPRSEAGESSWNFAAKASALRGCHRKNYCPSVSASIDMRERVKPRSRREIPAVNKVLDALGEYDLPRPLVVDLVRRGLSKIRSNSEIPEFESTVERLHRSLELFRASRLQPVINGTGIVIHTNFGRAPLTPEAVRVLTEIGSGYSNLEYDLATGDRGHRGAYIENALALLCGAEAATVINNCAAALVLIVHHFAARNGRSATGLNRRGIWRAV